jgi:hypothetical protein
MRRSLSCEFCGHQPGRENPSPYRIGIERPEPTLPKENMHNRAFAAIASKTSKNFREGVLGFIVLIITALCGWSLTVGAFRLGFLVGNTLLHLNLRTEWAEPPGGLLCWGLGFFIMTSCYTLPWLGRIIFPYFGRCAIALYKGLNS